MGPMFLDVFADNLLYLIKRQGMIIKFLIYRNEPLLLNEHGKGSLAGSTNLVNTSSFEGSNTPCRKNSSIFSKTPFSCFVTSILNPANDHLLSTGSTAFSSFNWERAAVIMEE